MLDLKKCPKCSNLTDVGNDICPYCGNNFEKKSQESHISLKDQALLRPITTINTSASKDWKTAWNELNTVTQWVILILIPLAVLGNPFGGIIGAAIGYFWLGPWAATFAKEHNRNINWAYFYGFAFVFLGCGLYWIYVKITTDPIHRTVGSSHRATTIGEWVVLAFSLIYAFLITLSEGIGRSLPDIAGFFIGSFFLSLIGLYMIYWIIGKLLPGSKYWGFVVWIFAIIGIPIIIVIILAIGAAFVFGMAGIIPNIATSNSNTYSTYENSGLGYKISYPDSWTYTTTNDPNANYITNTQFTNRDGKRGLLIQVVDLSGTTFQISSLDEWTKNGIAILQASTEFSQLTILKNERTTLAGYSAQRIEYTYVGNTGIKVKSIEYLLIKGSKGYNVAIFSTYDEFNDWSNTAQEIINSFKITV